MPATLPTQIGPFQLRGEIGRGGMGVVYLGRDTRLSRDVAIKVLPGEVAGNERRLERFKREARLLATLNHPHVAQIYSLEEHQGAQYLILEYVPGESLADFARRRSGSAGGGGMNAAPGGEAIGFRETARVLAQAVRGVEAAHARGLVHRDLKPDNIRVTPGPDRAAKILDFGLAKAVGDADEPPGVDGASAHSRAADISTMETVEIPASARERAGGGGGGAGGRGQRFETRAGAVVGTPGYMSPEQARGQEVDRRADVWALGCIVYECLSGRRAFVGQSFDDVIAATLHSEPDWGLLTPETPPGLAVTVKRCLEKDASRRPEDVHELRAALESAAGATQASFVAAPVAPTARPASPNNLPRQLTSFVGRGSQVAEVRRKLEGGALVTLVGAAGCGKTRLALRVAQDVLGEFDGGVWLVELAAVSDPRLVWSAIASAVGAREQSGKAPADAAIEVLRSRDALVIFDNCEHLLTECAAAADALLRGCPGVKVLATSREALGVDGEAAHRVPSMSLPPEFSGPGSATRTPGGGRAGFPGATTPPGVGRDVGSGSGGIGRAVTPGSGVGSVTAPCSVGTQPDLEVLLAYESVALFVERARASRPEFALSDATAGSVASICRRLDGIPLAIELAAAKIKVLGPEQIDAKLSDRFRILTGGSRTALERHQTLRAAIDWSFRLLTAPEQELLTRLSAFSGGFTLEAAERVCADDAETDGPGAVREDDVLDLLTRLIDKSLVVVDDGPDGRPRYRLLESVRQRALEALGAGELSADALRARHQRYFADLASAAKRELRGPEQRAWARAMDAEHQNLISAIEWGSASGVAGSVVRAMGIVSALADHWGSRGFLSGGRALGELALRAPGAAEAEPRQRSEAYSAIGSLARVQGDLRAAEKYFEQAAIDAEHAGDMHALAAAMVGRGNVLRQRGDLAGAAETYERALDLKRTEGDLLGVADVLINLGVTARQQANLEHAAALYEEASAILERAGDERVLAKVLNNLGTLAEDRGQLAHAADLYARVAVMGRRAGDLTLLALALSNLSGSSVAQGEAEKARPLLAEATEIRRASGDQLGLAQSLEEAIKLAVALGEYARAARFGGAAEALRTATGIRRSASREADIAGWLGRARAVLGPAFDSPFKDGREQTPSQTVEACLAWLSGAGSAAINRPQT